MLRIFLSSEMKTKNDLERRNAAKKEIEELGHIPVTFESLPSKYIENVDDMIEFCKKLVKESDIFFIIIDDDISEPMEAEYHIAKEYFDKSKIFYYFINNTSRSEKANIIWDNTKNNFKHCLINNNIELRKQIKKTISSYMEDILKSNPIILDQTYNMQSGEEKHLSYYFNKGDTITVTCLGNGPFYFGIYQRKEYIKLRGSKSANSFGFRFGDTSSQHTDKFTISESDDYYFVIRVSMIHKDKIINIKIRKD